MKTTGFWKTVLPDLSIQFGLDKVNTKGSVRALEMGLRKVIKKMDEDEFNVFLAQIVIKASGKAIMGVDLTKQIEIIRTLRK